MKTIINQKVLNEALSKSMKELPANLSLELLAPHHAAELFAVVDTNRNYLREWLPWLDMTCSVADIHRFIATAETHYLQGYGSQYILRFDAAGQSKICGVAGFHKIDKLHRRGAIGYWLAQSCEGQGLMTAVVEKLLTIGFADGVFKGHGHLGNDGQGRGSRVGTRSGSKGSELNAIGLNKIEIHCAVNNKKSRAIPERLGFRYEATLREQEWLYTHYVDHAIYSMLASEYAERFA